jgi:hypothetical protein
MPASKPHIPYLFHISNQDMEAGNRCSARLFHIFHMFHIYFPCAHVGAHTRTHVHAGVHPRTGLHFDMEDMEDMEEGHRTSDSSFHISAIGCGTYGTPGENQWN